MKKILSAIALSLAFTNCGYAQVTKNTVQHQHLVKKRYERGEDENKNKNVIQVTDNTFIRNINIMGKWVWQINKLFRSVDNKEKKQLTKPFIGDNRWKILTDEDFVDLFSSSNGVYVLQEILSVIVRNDPDKIEALATHAVRQGHFGYFPYYQTQVDHFQLTKFVFFLNDDLKTRYGCVIGVFSKYLACLVDNNQHAVEREFQNYLDEINRYIEDVQEYLRTELKLLDSRFQKSAKSGRRWPLVDNKLDDNKKFIFTLDSKDHSTTGRYHNPTDYQEGQYYHYSDAPYKYFRRSHTMNIVVSINKEGQIILNSIHP